MIDFAYYAKESIYSTSSYTFSFKDFKTKETDELWGHCYQCCSNIEGFFKADYCMAKDCCKVFEAINHSSEE